MARRSTQNTIIKLEAAVGEANARRSSAGSAIAEANARVAAAAAELVQANARAAELEAALTLARFNAPRVLSADQESRITEKLLALPPTPYELRSSRDPEAVALMAELGQVLRAAQWRPQDSEATAGPTSHGALPDGVSIEIAESRRADWEPTVIALILALREEGIHAVGQASDGADPSALHVTIGSKPKTAADYGQVVSTP
jgi:hypothetical protein